MKIELAILDDVKLGEIFSELVADARTASEDSMGGKMTLREAQNSRSFVAAEATLNVLRSCYSGRLELNQLVGLLAR